MNDLSQNRGFHYADAVFETLKVHNNKIFFLEDHYFRLMSAMRIMRMEIPLELTMDFFEKLILEKVAANDYLNVRVKIVYYRKSQGFYTPYSNEVDYVIDCTELPSNEYILQNNDYKVDVYKDFLISKNLLSNIKTTNKQIQVLAGIYSQDNDLDNCLLLNTDKQVIEAINGNIFVVYDDKIVTPPLSDGALNGIVRKNLINAKTINNKNIVEASISPFDLQNAEEVFITNVISGVIPIKSFRKKTYTDTTAKHCINYLNLLLT